MTDDLQSLYAERDRVRAILDAEQSFHSFIRQSWPQIEGNKPFIDSWYVGALAEHAQAAIEGQIKVLLINCPPRMTKTSIISIMLPAWTWIDKPDTKFLYASYAQIISFGHSRLCKMLIESSWYQDNWGHIIQLSKDQSTKGHFANTAHGYRIATSVGGATTALGGDVLVLDDPNSASEGGTSAVVREGVNDWIARTWSTRLNPGGLGVSILTAQRINEMDASGFWLSKDDNNDITKLIIPMEYESSRKCRTIILPTTKGYIWEDPRTEDGELICPDIFNKKSADILKVKLGTYNWAGQFQQRPAPEGGGLFKREWFQRWTSPKLPKLTYVLQSWDTALTVNEDSAYSACTTLATFKHQGVVNVMLLTCYREKLTYPELVKRAVRLKQNYLDIDVEPLEQDYKRQPDRILIEAKASGLPLVSDLVSKGIPATGFMPDEFGDKIQRVHLVTPFIECGRFWVCTELDSPSKLLHDHEMLINQCMPKGTLIYCIDGVKPIEDICPGDIVFTHLGNWKPVIRTMKNQTKRLIKIQGKMLDEMLVTPEHPVWKATLGIDRKFVTHGEWVESKDIIPREYKLRKRKGRISVVEVSQNIHHMLAIPMMVIGDKSVFDMEPYFMEEKGYSSYHNDDEVQYNCANSTVLKKKIPIDYDFGRFCGLFIAEGYSTNSNATFCFHKKENNLIEFVREFWLKNISECKPTIYSSKKDNGITIRFGCSFHKSFFYEFGQLAHNKKLPSWIFECNSGFLKGLVDGWREGDGHIIHSNGKISATSVSITLVYQMRLVLISLGICGHIVKGKEKKGHIIRERFVNSRAPYTLWWKEGERKVQNSKRNGNTFYFSVMKKEEILSECEVYNMEVLEDNSYVTTSGAVHNCLLFPKGESRDVVDTLTQGMLYLSKKVKMLTHVMNPRFERDASEIIVSEGKARDGTFKAI